MSKYFEVTGNLNKEETVKALNDYALKNTFVVIVDQPYPGYHYHTIDARMVDMKDTIFLVTKNRETWASIIRATDKLNKFLDETIDASFANLSLFNVPHYAIRIKGLNNLEDLETIQKAYQDEGFVFMKSKRMDKPKTVFFQIKRFFDIKEIGEGIYKDKEGMYFIKINRKIEWELFRKMTQGVKTTLLNSNFDVVNGAFYMNHTLVDIIRIFKPKCDLELLKQIRDEYEKQINKYY